MSFDTDIVVVGAGPTGLTLALQASMMGTSVRVLERHRTPRAWAPALAIHPRTMEILRGLGAADELLIKGLSRVDLRIHVGGSIVVGSLGDLHLPATEYPFIFFAPQPEVEHVLRRRLGAFGVEVEWGCELKDLEQGDGGVDCRVEAADEERRIRARYLVGCDGAESTVRDELGVRFRGRSYISGDGWVIWERPDPGCTSRTGVPLSAEVAQPACQSRALTAPVVGCLGTGFLSLNAVREKEGDR